jgi:hypothetical protein
MRPVVPIRPRRDQKQYICEFSPGINMYTQGLKDGGCWINCGVALLTVKTGYQKKKKVRL